MGTANISTMSALLKDLYLGPVTRQINDEVYLFNKLTTSTRGIMGNRAVLPVSYGRTSGIGVRDEDVDLPVAGHQSYGTLVYDFTSFYGIVRVTGQSQAKTKSQAGAFLEVLKSELDGCRRDLTKDLARQVYGNGTGQIAGITGAATGSVVPVASAEPLLKGQIYVNMLVDIADASGVFATGGQNQTVTAVDPVGLTVTVSGTPTTTSSHFFYRANAAAASSAILNKELNGLQKLFPTSANSLGGIDASVAANSWWDSLRMNAAGANSLDLMEQAAGNLRIHGGKPDLVVTSFGQRRIFASLLQSQLRYSDPTTFKAGFQTLDFNGLPLVGDVEAPFGKMYFLDTTNINVFQNEDWHFLDQDNSALKWVPNRDAWQAILARYFQIGMTRRNTSLVLYGLTGDSNGY